MPFSIMQWFTGAVGCLRVLMVLLLLILLPGGGLTAVHAEVPTVADVIVLGNNRV